MATVVAELILFRLRVAQNEGGDIDQILALANLDLERLLQPDARIDVSEEIRVWDAIAEHMNRDDIGLVCGANFPNQVASMVGYVMLNAPTLKVAVERVCAYQKLMGDSMGLIIHDENTRCRVGVELWSPWYSSLKYTIDITISAVVHWARNNTFDKVEPLAVGFHYERPPDIKPYKNMFYRGILG